MRTANTISVSITRFGGEVSRYSVPVDSTLGALFTTANISLASNESAYVGDALATVDDILENGDNVSIVQAKKGGATKKVAKKVAKAKKGKKSSK